LATKIRLKRLGAKHDPHFRIVVADERSRRDGSSIEEIGYYNPQKDPMELTVKRDRAEHWLALGAQPSDTVRSLLKREGVIAADDVAADEAAPVEEQAVEEAADEAVEEVTEEAAEAAPETQ